jgi:hypothetical protein
MARALGISEELLTKTVLKFTHPVLYMGLFGADSVPFMNPLVPRPQKGRKKR